MYHLGHASLQCSVFLYALSVLVQGCCPDESQPSAGEGLLEHVRRIDGSFRGSGPDDGVELVDKHDDIAGGCLHLAQYSLHPLLEFAAELGARHHAPDV